MRAGQFDANGRALGFLGSCYNLGSLERKILSILKGGRCGVEDACFSTRTL
jgi:hypothetical protein